MFEFYKELISHVESQITPLMAHEKVTEAAIQTALDTARDLKQYTRDTYGKQYKGKMVLLNNRVRTLKFITERNMNLDAFGVTKYLPHIESQLRELYSNQAFMALLNEMVLTTRAQTQERAKFRKIVKAYQTNTYIEIYRIACKYRTLLNPSDFASVYTEFTKEYHLRNVLDTVIRVSQEVVPHKTSSEECSICYNTYTKKQAVTLNCNHEFCGKCTETLTRTSVNTKCKCPMCRAPVTDMTTRAVTLTKKILKNSNKHNTFMEDHPEV